MGVLMQNDKITLMHAWQWNSDRVSLGMSLKICLEPNVIGWK
jgi:hypothetical protein